MNPDLLQNVTLQGMRLGKPPSHWPRIYNVETAMKFYWFEPRNSMRRTSAKFLLFQNIILNISHDLNGLHIHRKFIQVCSCESHWKSVSIGSGNGLMSWVKKTSPEPCNNDHNLWNVWRNEDTIDLWGLGPVSTSREVSKPRDWYFKLSLRHLHLTGTSAALLSGCLTVSNFGRLCNSKLKSRGYETLWYLTIRRLLGYWTRAQVAHI